CSPSSCSWRSTAWSRSPRPPGPRAALSREDRASTWPLPPVSRGGTTGRQGHLTPAPPPDEPPGGGLARFPSSRQARAAHQALLPREGREGFRLSPEG